MQIRIGLENGIEGRSLAWALDLPGCFAYGPDGQTAVIGMAQAVPAYISWMEQHTPEPWFSPSEIDLRLVETWEGYQIDGTFQRVKEGYEVNAWFLDDWVPLDEEEIQRGLRLLEWQRADLLKLVGGLDAGQLTHAQAGEWPVEKILRHIGTADWWYLARLGLAPISRDKLPSSSLERLEVARTHLYDALPGLAEINLVSGKDGEFWSPRKLLRRVVWHEKDHTRHIQRLVGAEQ